MSADDWKPAARNDEHAAERAEQLHGLVNRLCDQSPTAPEIAEVEALLMADPSLRKHYLKYVSIHVSMQNGTGNLSHAADDSCELASAAASRTGERRRWLAASLALAATVLAILVGAALVRSQSRVAPQPAPPQLVDVAPALAPVARITRLSNNVRWRNPDESIALHLPVRPGRLFRIERGEIQLTYDTGVELRLLAPADFTVAVDGGSLQRGGLRAVVPKAGRGFTIQTPNGKVVDLGTEFGVAVDDFGVSEVNVFQGMVDMVPDLRGDDADAIRLNQGEAVQWSGDTLIRLKADPQRFGASDARPLQQMSSAEGLAIHEDLQQGALTTSNWRTVGDVHGSAGSLALHGTGGPRDLPYLITRRQFAPVDGPLTVICDIRFIDGDTQQGASFAILTRSSDERNVDDSEDRRTMQMCLRCSLKSVDALPTGVIEAAMKLDRDCPLTNIQWRGFDRLQQGVPYRLVMTDDGINVRFTVSLRDDPSIRKSVTCRSLFRGKKNFVVLEGPLEGTVAVDRIQVYQATSADPANSNGNSTGGRMLPRAAMRQSIERALAAMAPADADLIIQDDFEGDALDETKWAALDDVDVINGCVRLGAPNADEHINTFTSRPYLLTREPHSPADGVLTIVGVIEFETNFLNEYGGSFAVMTRAEGQRGIGPGWEYSILRTGVRSNFWPAAWGQQHSLEVHEKPSPTSLTLLVAEGLEINPGARAYCFKVVDDGRRATLTIQDAVDPLISKTVSIETSHSLKSGLIGFESCWGCPVWLDNVRIYRALPAQQ